MPTAGVSRKPRKGSIAWYGAEAERYLELSEKHGGLTTPSIAAFIIGVSRQRMHQLLDAGRLTTYDVLERRWLPVDEVESFAMLERRGGRPTLAQAA